MSPTRELLLRRHMDGLGDVGNGEASLLPWLMHWLIATGRVRYRTHVAYEVPWLGRRVDLALLTARGTTSAFELKLGRLQRVLEQASYNDLSFHRSWVVVGNHPQAGGLEWAQRLGLGLIVVRPPSVTLLLRPVVRSPDHSVMRRVRVAIATRAPQVP
jgi:hypothetical protein